MKKSTKLFALILAAIMTISIALPASATDATLPEGMEWMTPFDETVKLDVVVGWDADSIPPEEEAPDPALLARAEELAQLLLTGDELTVAEHLVAMEQEKLKSGELAALLSLTEDQVSARLASSPRRGVHQQGNKSTLRYMNFSTSLATT